MSLLTERGGRYATRFRLVELLTRSPHLNSSLELLTRTPHSNSSPELLTRTAHSNSSLELFLELFKLQTQLLDFR